MICIVPGSFGTMFGHNTIICVPPEDLAAFKEIIRRGLAFEHGEPKYIHEFFQILNSIPNPEPPSTTPTGSVSSSV